MGGKFPCIVTMSNEKYARTTSGGWKPAVSRRRENLCHLQVAVEAYDRRIGNPPHEQTVRANAGLSNCISKA